MNGTISRWWPSGVVVLGAIGFFIASPGLVGIAAAVLLLVVAWMISPAFFPQSADLQVARQRAAAGQAPLVFWKPGCTYCILLRMKLASTGRRVSWVDSSVDEQARAVVRSANEGDHTTPTVMFREETRTNPDAVWVRSLVQ